MLRVLCGAVLAAAACLYGQSASADKVDLSTMTCKQFLDSPKDEVAFILTWLDGYYQNEDAPPVFDTDEFVRNAEKLGEYCSAHESIGLITAADEVLAEK